MFFFSEKGLVGCFIRKSVEFSAGKVRQWSEITPAISHDRDQKKKKNKVSLFFASLIKKSIFSSLCSALLSH